MRIGIFAGSDGRTSIDEVVAQAKAVHADGFDSYWIPQIFNHDALVALAVIGREVPDLELGTAVVPVWMRHPQALAIQARTVQAVCDGRLALGIGLMHKPAVEPMFDIPFERPVGYMKEYLSILAPLVRDGSVSFAGERLTYHGPVDIDAAPVPILLAALGTQMLGLCGRETDGTITWMTGPKTLGEHVRPILSKAAAEAGRPEPRVVAALPVAVTDDPDGARVRAEKVFAMYNALPSYRAMLDLEGAQGPGDVAIVGDEATVERQVRALPDVGVTDFVAVEFAPHAERARTRALISSLT